MEPKRNLRPSSLVTLVVVVFFAAVLLSPTLLRTRILARRAACNMNMAILLNGLQQYQTVYHALAFAAGGTDGYECPENGNDTRLSGLVGILPFIEQVPLYKQIRAPYLMGDRKFPAFGPVPNYDPSIYPFWGVRVAPFVCPAEPIESSTFGTTNYIFCYGDGARNIGSIASPSTSRSPEFALRGLFARGVNFRSRDCTDGRDTTIALGETTVGIGDTMPAANMARGIAGIMKSPAMILNLVEGDKKNKRYKS